MPSKLFLKITNEEECHNGYQYKNGLNELEGKFNDNPEDSCVPGRLYFSKPNNICNYLNYGIYLREVYLPIDNPDFKMIEDPEGNKYGANMIILGKRRDLRNPKTWKYMISVGVDIHAYNDEAFKWAYLTRNVEVMEFLIENGANIHAEEDYALRWAAGEGYLEVVKCLIENGANIHAQNDYALRWASNQGHLKIVKYLIKNGANIYAQNNYALKWATEQGHLEIINYLMENSMIIE
ncbi:ankyrin repeat protein [Megavirus baoshan]|uniref:Ankyrin repeat protein n=1 Tax=Megavirus baoshan TaxID=2496520 RepID=A0A3S8UXX7_9VIRU|nr:ankyrin repeat protein [Megavirus baoshan]AZL89666.1 ankyrin repeat protein [Megavirus baoshan]